MIAPQKRACKTDKVIIVRQTNQAGILSLLPGFCCVKTKRFFLTHTESTIHATAGRETTPQGVQNSTGEKERERERALRGRGRGLLCTTPHLLGEWAGCNQGRDSEHHGGWWGAGKSVKRGSSQKPYRLLANFFVSCA